MSTSHCPAARTGGPWISSRTRRYAHTPGARWGCIRPLTMNSYARVTNLCSTRSMVPGRCPAQPKGPCRSSLWRSTKRDIWSHRAITRSRLGLRSGGEMIRRLARWLDDRLGASSFTREALNKVFPDHWSFMIGEVALYCFVILVLTGVFLTLFFDASTSKSIYEGTYEPLNGVEVSDAYRSVVELSFDVRAGLVMRQIHHWAALVFIAAIVVHLCRIFFTGAFRRPREINWMIGVTLLALALFNGFTGYSLPDDLLSGTGLRIAYSIAISVPLLGTWMAF